MFSSLALRECLASISCDSIWEIEFVQIQTQEKTFVTFGKMFDPRTMPNINGCFQQTEWGAVYGANRSNGSE